MRLGRHPRPRFRPGFAWAAALAFALAAPLARGEDEPGPKPPVPEPVLLAGVVSDPGGEATRTAHEALAALAADDVAGAYDRLVRLAEDYGDTLVPVSLFAGRAPGRADGALRWPAHRVANHALASLSPAYRERLDERWAPRTLTLWQRTQRGDAAALARLADRYPATRRGSRALLMAAERDLEAGRRTAAARALQRWLDLNAETTPEVRAGVVIRLADALADLEDAGALEALQVLHRDLRSVPVRAGGVETTLAERMAAWRAREVELPPVEAPPFDLAQTATPVLLWSRSLEDPGLLKAERRSQGELSVRAGAWGQGDTLVLHEGRVLRRLDLRTGLERWRFPGVSLATLHDPRERYATYDLPFRSVTPAPGGRILAVLGDPAATGRYSFLSQEFDADELGQECRTRLVCLDLETGALRWMTGGAADTHPILGDGATGCSSPPLVAGDRVYCLFARTLGATAFYLACLDLETGAAVWVKPLASGESGRNDDRAGARDRFTGTYLQSVPWGARPSLHDGEVCAVPHAGFAAGVAAEDGTVRWLRALPRYSRDVPMPANRGHSVRNVPVPWGDAWLLAPMDCPQLLCLARGTGDLRWQRGGPARDAPPWRDLLGVRRDAAGRPLIRLSGFRPMTMDPADGSVPAGTPVEAWEAFDGDAAGVALDTGRDVLHLGADSLQAHRWEPDPGDDPGRVVHMLQQPGVPTDGDLYLVDDVLVAVGLTSVAVLTPPPDAPDAWARRLESSGLDEGGTAAAMALRAVLARDPKLMADAVLRAGRAAPRTLRARVEERLGALLERAAIELEARHLDEEGELADAEVEAWADAAEALPRTASGSSLRRIAQLLLDRSQDERAARLLVAWVADADDALVEAGETRGLTGGLRLREGRVRGDLVAGAMLRHHADRPAVRAVLEAREDEAERALRAARGEASTRAAIRRYAGTRAVDGARRSLIEKLTGRGRHAGVAALIADRRLDPPWLGPEREDEARLVDTARLQLAEAEALDRAGDGERARTLVADLRRWVPGGRDGTIGRRLEALRKALNARYGWYPLRGQRGPEFDAWRGLEPPNDRDGMRSVEFLGLEGPGADMHRQVVVLVRGLTVEIWSLHTRRRLAVLHGGDEGWFGGSLTSIDRWVPGGGIRVMSIVAGEPADTSGVQAGDWVRTWNGKPVHDLPTFMNLVASSKPGVEIPVSVHRRGAAVMDRFAAGRRPAAQGRMLDYDRIHVAADGRLLVPGRTGLTWVDIRARTRTPAWTWREPGVLRRAYVLGGRAYATIQRGLQPDVVVAVDLGTGREVWRREVRGGIGRVEAVGSAIWIHAVSPSHAVLVDRDDGRVRGDYRCFDFHRHEFRKNWTESWASAVAAGRGFVVSGWWGHHTLHIVNTTSGRVEHAESWSPGTTRRGYSRHYVNPQVAASGFVAVVKPPGLRLFLPDPLGRAPVRRVDVDHKLLMANEPHYGRVDQDSRIFIRGDTLYLLRVPIQGRQNVSLCVFGATFEGLGTGSTNDFVSGGDVFHMRTKRSWMQGSALPTRYVLDARPHFEGIFVSSARLAGDHQTESWWISALHEDRDENNRDVRFRADEVQEARRPLPVRVGRRLLVATDRGARFYVVERSGR